MVCTYVARRGNVNTSALFADLPQSNIHWTFALAGLFANSLVVDRPGDFLVDVGSSHRQHSDSKCNDSL